MKLSIPANWQDDFFEQIDFSSVYEVYGKLPGDFVGGGRASVIFKDVSSNTFKKQVRKIRDMGISFNYLLNATCLDNLEFTRKGNRQIRRLLQQITDAGVDTVTIALAQLIPMIREKYPDMRISVSTNNMVNNLERVRYWEEFGADKITLSYTDLNRNFKELKRIVEHKKCTVQLICNLICRKHCPFQAQHANFHSHASQTQHVNKRLPLDYHCMNCLARNFSNPKDIIRAPWIRPEDLKLYENIGIEHFKLAERGMNTNDLALIVNAYTQRSYDGNFMDLIPSMSKYEYIANPSTGHFMKYLGQFRKVRLRTIRKSLKAVMALKDLSAFYQDMGMQIDNKSMAGFAKYFTTHHCQETVCEECAYCDKWAEKVIHIKDEKQRDHAVKVFENILSTLTSDALY